MLEPGDQALAQRLRELRFFSKLKQKQLARAIGVTRGTLSHYEHGRICIPYKRHAAIARALGFRQIDLYAAPGSPRPRLWREPSRPL